MRFDATLRKYFGVVHLAIVAVIAYLQASAVTQVIVAAIAPRGTSFAGGAGGAGAAPAPNVRDDHATSARALLDRNPFDSRTRRPLDAMDRDGGSPADGGLPAEMQTCEGSRALIVVASSDAAWSMAVVSARAEGVTKVVRVGSELAGKTVELVEWNRVVLSSGSARCEMVMFRSDKASEKSVKPPPPPNLAGGIPPEIASKIQRLGPTEFNVDRQAVGAIIERQAELMGSVRVVPVQETGRVIGLQLFGVRPGTILGMLGFEPGDRLQTVNGFDLTNAENAMQALARLRTADHLTVQVNRRGQDTNLDFNVK